MTAFLGSGFSNLLILYLVGERIETESCCEGCAASDFCGASAFLLEMLEVGENVLLTLLKFSDRCFIGR